MRGYGCDIAQAGQRRKNLPGCHCAQFCALQIWRLPRGAKNSAPFGTIFGSEGAANLRPLKGERNFVPMLEISCPLERDNKEGRGVPPALCQTYYPIAAYRSSARTNREIRSRSRSSAFSNSSMISFFIFQFPPFRFVGPRWQSH